MKRRQRARLGSMGRKRDTMRRRALAGGEMIPGRRKGVDDASWADTNLTGPKKFTWSIGLLQMDGEDLKQP
jgi:hypothetical protein